METKFTDEEINNHFQHMCESGYDPLLCVRKTQQFIDFSGKEKFFTKESIQFIDRIVTKERYLDLIKNGEVSTRSSRSRLPTRSGRTSRS